MNNKKTRMFVVTTICGVVALVAFSVTGMAQGRYTNTYSRNQVDDIVRRAENSSDTFRTDFRNQMNRNNNLSSRQKATYNSYVANCEQAIDQLRRRFDSDNNWWNSRNQVQSVITSSQNVNTMMNVISFRRNLERQWNQLRNDLNTLADTFDLPGLNGGGWNGGGGGGGGGPIGGGGHTSTPPTWAQGTFYSTNGSNIQMTIASNGRVTVVNGGQSYYGTFYRNNITVNGDMSTVSRNGNGLSTYNRNTGQTTTYSRNGWGNGPGPGPGWGGGGQTSTPPNWAQGSFYALNNGAISLTINRNGQVTVVNGGQTYYGTYYNGSITVNGDTSTVSRNGNGIRTYNRNQGVTTDYRRR